VQSPEPSHEELVGQIAEVLGKAQPPRSRKMRVLSIITSIAIRSACICYSLYLGFLFARSFVLDKLDKDTRPTSTLDYIMMVLVIGFFLFLIFRKVYGDRLTPVDYMLRRTLARGMIIILTFLFWNWIFSSFPSLSYTIFAQIITFLIFASGYDFHLRPRSKSPPRKNLSST